MSPLQRCMSVLFEGDGVTGPLQEVRLELADVRIAIDDQDDRFAFFWLFGLVRQSHL